MKEFAARGWEADVGFIRPDETAGPTVERLLGSKRYDCVVIVAPRVPSAKTGAMPSELFSQQLNRSNSFFRPLQA